LKILTFNFSLTTSSIILNLEIHGTCSQARGFDFDASYGRDHAGSYIEVHHVKPLSVHEGEMDPASDLACLCTNCHRMAHRRKTSVTSVDELRDMIEQANGCVFAPG